MLTTKYILMDGNSQEEPSLSLNASNWTKASSPLFKSTSPQNYQLAHSAGRIFGSTLRGDFADLLGASGLPRHLPMQASRSDQYATALREAPPARIFSRGFRVFLPCLCPWRFRVRREPSAGSQHLRS